MHRVTFAPTATVVNISVRAEYHMTKGNADPVKVSHEPMNFVISLRLTLSGLFEDFITGKLTEEDTKVACKKAYNECMDALIAELKNKGISVFNLAKIASDLYMQVKANMNDSEKILAERLKIQRLVSNKSNIDIKQKKDEMRLLALFKEQAKREELANLNRQIEKQKELAILNQQIAKQKELAKLKQQIAKQKEFAELKHADLIKGASIMPTSDKIAAMKMIIAAYEARRAVASLGE